MCVLYKLKLVTETKIIMIRIKIINYHSLYIPSLISESAGIEEVRSHDIVSDKVVLNVIPLSSLLNTHSVISPASVGGRIHVPGLVLNDMLT